MLFSNFSSYARGGFHLHLTDKVIRRMVESILNLLMSDPDLKYKDLVTVYFLFFSSSALAVQRYIYVCHAPVAKQWCTVSRSWMFVTMILLGAATTMMPRLLDRNYSVTTSGNRDISVTS